jgi:hypothetical protein
LNVIHHLSLKQCEDALCALDVLALMPCCYCIRFRLSLQAL